MTAGGKIVRDLEMREDVPGKPIRLTIDGPLQDYAARRIGIESGEGDKAEAAMAATVRQLKAKAGQPAFRPGDVPLSGEGA